MENPSNINLNIINIEFQIPEKETKSFKSILILLEKNFK